MDHKKFKDLNFIYLFKSCILKRRFTPKSSTNPHNP